MAVTETATDGDLSGDLAHAVESAWVAREHRVPQQLPAYLTARQEKINCYTTDLSGSGVGLIAPLVLPNGMCVSVTLKLGGADTLAMKGTIRWSRAGRIGVQLERLDHRLLMLLAAANVRIASEALAPPEGALESFEEPSDAAGGLEMPAELPDLPPFPRLPRYRENLPALHSTGGLFWSRATIMDVSARGVGVYAGAFPAVGEVVHLEFTLPDGGETQVAGRVAWAAHAADGEPQVLAGIALHYAQEEFYRFVLERESTADHHAVDASTTTR